MSPSHRSKVKRITLAVENKHLTRVMKEMQEYYRAALEYLQMIGAGKAGNR